MVLLWLAWGCVRSGPLAVSLPDTATSCAIPAESAQVSVDPPEGPVFQVAVSGQAAMPSTRLRDMQ